MKIYKSTRLWPALVSSLTFMYGVAIAAQSNTIPHTQDAVPPRLFECESTNCTPRSGQEGLWTLRGTTGEAHWRSGAVARLTVERYDTAGVVIDRTDLPSSASRGLTAVYSGTIHGDRIDGSVTWTWPGHWNNRPANGTWSAIIPAPDSNPTNSQSQIAAVPEHLTSAAPTSPLAAPTSIVPAAAGGCDPKNTSRITAADAMAHAKQFDAAQDFRASACWIYVAAVQGNAVAEISYSKMLSRGRDVLKDDRAAAIWAEKANASSMIPKASGDCDPSNPTHLPADEAFARSRNYDPDHDSDPVRECWTYVAAVAGNGRAEFAYARVLYYKGLFSNHLSTSFEWAEKAANQGVPDAEELVGLYYSLGQGVKQNKEAAFGWHKKAAEAGQLRAEYNLGRCYFDGEGTSVNVSEANRWWLKAGEAGNAAATWSLFLDYSNGEEGFPENPERARYWRAKAVKFPELISRVKEYDKRQLAIDERIAAGKRAKAHGRTLDEQLYAEWLEKLSPSEVAEERHAYFTAHCFRKTVTRPDRRPDGGYDSTVSESHTEYIYSEACAQMEQEVNDVKLTWKFGRLPGFGANSLLDALFQ